jgi:hypothetical protein
MYNIRYRDEPCLIDCVARTTTHLPFILRSRRDRDSRRVLARDSAFPSGKAITRMRGPGGHEIWRTGHESSTARLVKFRL